jgi:hypothetical protein
MPATEMPNRHQRESQTTCGVASESSLAIDQTELDGLVGALTSQRNNLARTFGMEMKKISYTGSLANNSPAILEAV